MSEAELEERKLRKKLDELTGNISDKGLSSDDDEAKKAPAARETPARSAARGNAPPIQPVALSSSSDELPSDARKVGAVSRPNSIGIPSHWKSKGIFRNHKRI